MDGKQVWMIVGISLIVAIASSFITASLTSKSITGNAMSLWPTSTNAAKACNADSICETNSIITNGITCNGCDKPTLLRFTVNSADTIARATIYKWASEQNEWLQVCQDKLIGDFCNVDNYALQIVSITEGVFMGRSVEVSLTSGNGYLVPGGRTLKVSEEYDYDTYQVNDHPDLTLLILPKEYFVNLA